MTGQPFTPLARPGDPTPEGWDARGDDPATAFPVPWRWWEPVAVFAVSFLISNVLVLVVLVVSVPLGMPEPVQVTIAALLSSGVLFASTLVWVRARHPGAIGRLAGPVRPRLVHVGIGAGAGLLAFAVGNVGFGQLITWLIRRLGGEPPPVQEALQSALQDPVTGIVLAVAVVVAAPLAEELFFRGFLFQGLRRSVPLWPAMGLSGLAFALSHIEPLAIVILLPVGMFFAWIFHRTGSLLVPISAHAAFNLVNVVLLRLPPDWAARLVAVLGLPAEV